MMSGATDTLRAACPRERCGAWQAWRDLACMAALPAALARNFTRSEAEHRRGRQVASPGPGVNPVSADAGGFTFA